jgi:hypothetical protein
LTFSTNNIEPGSGYSRVHGFISLLAQDKSPSMKAAGENEIADVCLRILEAGMRAGGEDNVAKNKHPVFAQPRTGTAGGSNPTEYTN